MLGILTNCLTIDSNENKYFDNFHESEHDLRNHNSSGLTHIKNVFPPPRLTGYHYINFNIYTLNTYSYSNSCDIEFVMILQSKVSKHFSIGIWSYIVHSSAHSVELY